MHQCRSSTRVFENIPFSVFVLACPIPKVGVEVLSDLRSQREVIQRTKGNLRIVGTQLQAATQMVNRMLLRAKVNKCLTGSALLFLVLFAVGAYIIVGMKSAGSDAGAAATSSTANGGAPSPAGGAPSPANESSKSG